MAHGGQVVKVEIGLEFDVQVEVVVVELVVVELVVVKVVVEVAHCL